MKITRVPILRVALLLVPCAVCLTAPADSTAQTSGSAAAGVQFDIGGLRPGMTAEQLARGLQESGFSADPTQPGQFWKGDSQDRRRSLMTVQFGWYGPVTLVKSIGYMPVYRSVSDAELASIFEGLVAEYGEPDECASRSPADRCTWTREFNSWDETLNWRIRGGRAFMQLAASNVIDDKDFAAANTGASSGDETAPSEHKSRPLFASLEGVRLGTARQDVGPIVEAKGYEPWPPNSDAAGKFRRRSGQSYDEFIDFEYADDRVSSIVLRLKRSPANYEQSREELIARLGPPDSCDAAGSSLAGEMLRKHSNVKTAAGKPTPPCEWNRKNAGQIQRVHVTWTSDRQELYQLQYAK